MFVPVLTSLETIQAQLEQQSDFNATQITGMLHELNALSGGRHYRYQKVILTQMDSVIELVENAHSQLGSFSSILSFKVIVKIHWITT